MKPAASSLALVATVGLLVSLAGCAKPKPPAHWISGGGRLDLVPARWEYDGDPVEIRPRGDYAEVLVDGDVEFIVDRVGRVYTRYQQPVAILEPDGRLVGHEQELLGNVGSSYAAQPGKANAWLALSPDGRVVKFEEGGGQKPSSQWTGCSVTPFSLQACLLVTYLLYFEDEGQRAPDLPPVPITPMGGMIVP
ncbi:MAG: hypothetical protein HOW73_46480 [Polyangiaceae bacterium]|nr:hypothetical protein [Polyangiaceae bacterium]